MGKIVLGGAAISILLNIILAFWAMSESSKVSEARAQVLRAEEGCNSRIVATNQWWRAECERQRRETFSNDARETRTVKDLTFEIENKNAVIKQLEADKAKLQQELTRVKGGALAEAQSELTKVKERLQKIETDQSSVVARQVVLDGGLFTDLVTTDSRGISLRLAKLTREGGVPKVIPLRSVKAFFSDQGSTEQSSPSSFNATSAGIFTLRVPSKYAGPVTIQVQPLQ